MNVRTFFSQTVALALTSVLAVSANLPATAWGDEAPASAAPATGEAVPKLGSVVIDCDSAGNALQTTVGVSCSASAPFALGVDERGDRTLTSLTDCTYRTAEGQAAGMSTKGRVFTRTMAASVGEEAYPSLQAAVDAARPGDTVSLLADVQIEEPVSIPAGKDVVVDLGGHAVEGRVPAAADSDTIRGAFEVAGSALFEGGGRVANATDARNAAAILVQPGGSVVLADVGVASGGAVGSSGSAVYAYGNLAVGQARIGSDDVGIACNGDSTVVIEEGASITAKGNCIGTKAGNAGKASVTINGGTFATAIEGVSEGDYWDHGVVFWADKGSLDINGGAFGSALPKAPGVYQKNGTVTIAGGTFEACDGLKADATAGDTVSIKTVVAGGTFEGTRSGLYFNGKNGASFTIDVSGGTFAGGGEGALYTKDSSAVVSLTGGTFSTDVEGYCAPGYATRARDDGSGWYDVVGNHEAAVGDARFATLGEALKAAGDGDTVRLLRNVETPYVFVYHSGVIDLAGYTLTGSSTYNVLYQGSTYSGSGLPLTIRNGSIECPNGHGLLVDKGEVVLEDIRVNVGSPSLQEASTALSVQGGAHLTVAADCVVESRNAADNKSAYALTVFDGGTLADIKGTLRADGLLSAAISGSGAYDGTSINVYPGAVVDGGKNGLGIYHPQEGALAVEGGSVEGATGIEMRAGSLDVSGDAVITGTMSPTQVKPNGNGGTTAGAGIAVAQHSTKRAISVGIAGGTISGYSALYESNPEGNPPDSISQVSLSVTGGTFKAADDGTLVVYSENKRDFIAGGMFDRVLDPLYYDEDVYRQNAQDAPDAPGAVVPRTFAIEYDLGGGTFADGAGNPDFYTYFSEGFTLAEPMRAGYTFAGWAGTDLAAPTLEVVVPAKSTGDRAYKATWTANANTPYTVEHCFQDVEGDGYTIDPDKGQALSGTTGESTAASPLDAAGFTPRAVDQQSIAGDGSTVVKVYYDRNVYDVSYAYAGDEPPSAPDLPAKATARFGETVTPAAAPATTGYTFSGWSRTEAFSMPAGNVVITGSWEANTDVGYTVHYYLDGTEKRLAADKAVAGRTFAQAYVEQAPALEGYTVKGPATQEVVLDAYGKEAAFYYTADEARIVFVANGGSKVDDLVGATGEGVQAPLPAPTRDGYAFAGWYADETLQAPVAALPATYPAGTIAYYAKWNAVPLPPDETGNVEIQVEAPAPPADGGPHATVTEETVEAAAKHAARALEAIEKGEAPAGMTAEDAQRVDALVSGADAADVRVIVSLGFEKKDEGEVDDGEKSAIGGAASAGESVRLYLDLSVKMIVQVVKDGSVQGWHEAALGEVEDPLLFEIHVEPGLIAGKGVRIAHVHGDEREAEVIVPEGIDRDRGIVRFYASRFSTYALLASGTVTVTFDSLGGSAVPAQSVAFGGTVAKPDDPTRAGCTFGGWFADEACTQAFDFDAPIERPLTLFAEWTAVDPGPNPDPDPNPNPYPGPCTDPGAGHKPDGDGGPDPKPHDTPSEVAGTKRLVGTGDGTGALAAPLAGIAALAAAGALAAALRRRRSR